MGGSIRICVIRVNVNLIAELVALSIPLWVFALGQEADASTLARHETKPTKSARQFVQRFYDAYVSKIWDVKSGDAWQPMLKAKALAFSPRLLSALVEDAAASSKSKDEIVGLDFDPILNSQDPAHKYVVGTISTRNGHYWVKVHSIDSGKPSEEVAVIAEVETHHQTWRFTNFVYPGNQDLMTILRDLKKARHKA